MIRRNAFLLFSRPITIVVVMSMVLFTSLQCTRGEPVKIKVCYKNTTNFLIFFVAQENGYFKELGLEIEPVEMASTNLMIEGVVAGRLHVNPMNSVPSLYAVEENSPGILKIFYFAVQTEGRTTDAILVAKDSKITALEDLKGKKIAGFPGTTTVVLIKHILKNFMDPEKDVQILELEPRMQLQALAVGQIDALLTFEPLITMGREKGISRILVNEPMEKYIMHSLPIAAGIMSSDFIRKNPVIAEKIIRAMNKAIDFVRQNESEARKIMAKYTGLPKETADSLGINIYWKLNEIDKSYVQKFADLLYKEGALARPVNTVNMYVNY